MVMEIHSVDPALVISFELCGVEDIQSEFFRRRGKRQAYAFEHKGAQPKPVRKGNAESLGM